MGLARLPTPRESGSAALSVPHPALQIPTVLTPAVRRRLSLRIRLKWTPAHDVQGLCVAVARSRSNRSVPERSVPRRSLRGQSTKRMRPPGDMFSPARRSEIMSHIRGLDTKPERLVRSYLHTLGFRFRLHDPALPGRPDITLPKYRLAVFVHGCFWHLHSGCPAGRLPTARRAFWKHKLEGNRERDVANIRRLRRQGWRVLVLWECDIERRPHVVAERLIRAITNARSIA